MSNSSNYKLYEEERKALRNELYNLKSCQITFLTTSVTATGLLLGLATTLVPKDLSLKGITFVFPLIVLIPSWWIFFDKPTTITRVVGYYRILEKLILNQYTTKRYIGWENSLRLSRERKKEKKYCPPPDLKKIGFSDWIKEMIFFQTGHRYWIIAYYTFFALSALCTGIGLFYIPNFWINLFLIINFTISAIWNARMVWFLIHKKYSYNWNEEYWKKILNIKRTTIKNNRRNRKTK